MKRSPVISAAILLLVLTACAKQSLKATYDKQATTIESFVSARLKADPYATLTRNGGAYRVTLHDTLDRVFGQRDSLKDGGRVVLGYACYILSGTSLTSTNLVATNVRGVASAAGWELSDTTRYKLDTLTLDKSLVKGLQDGLAGVQQYDECIVLFTGESGFGNVSLGTIPARSALAYQLWIESIDNEK